MRELVVVGLGELGQLYGAGALRAGVRVTPITRRTDPAEVLRSVGPEVPILVAVAEDALDDILARLQPAQRGSVILLQNELFPSRWQRHGIEPTVLVPWLVKKRGLPLTVARPTATYGRFARLFAEVHEALALPVEPLSEPRELHLALVAKYAFIVTINALGLMRDRTLALWLQEDPLRVRTLAEEAAALGARLCEAAVDLGACVRMVEEAMRALAPMSARGRSADARIARALANAEQLAVAMPELARSYAEAHAT